MHKTICLPLAEHGARINGARSESTCPVDLCMCPGGSKQVYGAASHNYIVPDRAEGYTMRTQPKRDELERFPRYDHSGIGKAVA